MRPNEHDTEHVEDLPLEEVDMEASDRALDDISPAMRARLRALGIDVSTPEAGKLALAEAATEGGGK